MWMFPNWIFALPKCKSAQSLIVVTKTVLIVTIVIWHSLASRNKIPTFYLLNVSTLRLSIRMWFSPVQSSPVQSSLHSLQLICNQLARPGENRQLVVKLWQINSCAGCSNPAVLWPTRVTTCSSSEYRLRLLRNLIRDTLIWVQARDSSNLTCQRWEPR